MRLLFSSLHDGLVEEIGKKLTEAGICCEVRYSLSEEAGENLGSYRELWIGQHQEMQWAVALVAMHCAIGRN